MVGFDEVLQQTPLADTGDPPSDVTVPPQTALFDVTEDTELVETVGVADDEFVVKITFDP